MSHSVKFQYVHGSITLQVAHSLGFLNRDVRPDNMLVHSYTGLPYLVDWGSAAERSDIAGSYEGTVHYSAARILRQLALNSQTVTFTTADDLESLVCSAFCLSHPDLQAQLELISKSQVDQIQDWWQQNVWQQRSCWHEAVEVARKNDYQGVVFWLQKLMQ